MRMRIARRRGALAVAAAAAVAAVLAATPFADADAGGADDRGGDRLTYAVIGDTPYGDPQLAGFPADVAEIDAARGVSRVIHLGDIKNGSSRCSDEYLARIRRDFDEFDDPLVFTPGDNEWTDCHRENNGSFDPLERRDAIRSVFFDRPGRTLGERPARVTAQAAPDVENVRWQAGGIVFATAHVVGSNNGWALWTNRTSRTPEQVADVEGRTDAAVQWIAETFDDATRRHARGVVIGIQADMWDPAFTGPRDDATQYDRFTPVVQELARRARDFGRPVLLLNGDSHVFADERPLADPARPHLRTMYDVAATVPNLRRITVNGSTTPCHEWLRLRVDPKDPALFTVARVPFATQPGFDPTVCPSTAPEPPPAMLLGRAILPSDAYQPGPPSGSLITPDNGVTTPFPSQPIPGFSAVLRAGKGQFLAMPDNGYGAKGNSADFLLRVYRIRPDFRTARAGSGRVEVLGFVQLSDPDAKIPFPLTRPDRLLTGADFDLESVRRTTNGDLWFGEEFGPFLLHTDATGRVLEAPIPLPGVRSPQNPFLIPPDAANLPPSRGFEGMAITPDGRTLLPVLEGALRDDPDPRRRIVNEFDLRAGTYTGRTWSYRVDAGFPNAVLGDVTALDAHRLLVIERDDAQGADARQKKVYLVDLRRVDGGGHLEKRLILDLLIIADPAGVSSPARPGEFGVGDPFAFPLQSVESLEVLGGRRLLIANDNNYPFSDGRWAGRDRPDDTELIVVHAPALRGTGGGTR